MNIEKLKYPIGHYVEPKEITNNVINSWIAIIQEFPQTLKIEVEGMNEEQLNAK